MSFQFEERPSDSPLVEKVWRTHSAGPGTFTSIAASNMELVISRVRGRTSVTLRGPETRATPARAPGDAEHFGIIFRLGAFMPDFPASSLMDRSDLTLPGLSERSFWLNGSAWEIPDFDNADTFIERLTRQELLVRDDLIDDVLQGRPQDVTGRTVRRRFLRATGLTPGAIHQIERARLAIQLLRAGMSILDTVDMAGFYDQPHLHRALRRFAGQTPLQLAAQETGLSLLPPAPMSLLYNTWLDEGSIMSHIQPTLQGELI